MSHPAFDSLWDAPTKPTSADPLDAAWDAPHDPNKIHRDFASGALQKRNARADANDKDMLDAEPGYLDRLGSHVLNTGQGIPGVEAVEAAGGALGSQLTSHPMGYGQSLQTLRDNTSQIGGKTAAAERMMGSLATLPFLPSNGAAAGALLGGADQALAADPESLAARAGKTAAGAAGGALVGKVGEHVMTGARVLASTNSSANVLARQAARAASAQQLYGKAMQEGQGKLATASINRFLAQPDIAEIVGELQQTRPFQGVGANTPEMLDAVYKTLSDRAATVKKGLESVAPTRPNIGRFRGQDIQMAQHDALDAMSGGASMPGPMPTYRTAVNDFATQSRGIEGVQQGQNALRTSVSKGVTTGKNLDRTTPEAFGEWAGNASLPERQAASEGVLGAAREDLLKNPLRNILGARAMHQAPGLLRATNTPQQQLFTNALRALLAGGNATLQ